MVREALGPPWAVNSAVAMSSAKEVLPAPVGPAITIRARSTSAIVAWAVGLIDMRRFGIYLGWVLAERRRRPGKRERRMRTVAMVMLAASCAAWGQNTAASGEKVDHASAYYHYAMAHIYAELAGEPGGREYIDKALENYKEALKADPTSAAISDELAEFYVQAGLLADAEKDADEALAEGTRRIWARCVCWPEFIPARSAARIIASIRTCSRRPSSSTKKSPTWRPRTWMRG